MQSYKLDTPWSGVWVRAVLLGVVSWALLTCGTMFYAARNMRLLPVGGETAVSIGPLELIHVVKTATGGGFVLSFSLRHGFMVLGLLCCAVQVATTVGMPALLQYVNRRRLVQVRKK